MTTNSEFDRHAAAFLADGPTELADRVLDAALREVHQTRQRRRWSMPWRTSLMSLRLSAGIGIAIVAVAGLAAFSLIGGTAPPPVATPSPAATASCGHELAQGLYLTAGCTYRTSNLPPTLSIVSDGTWLDTFQTSNALDFIVNTGPALNTSLRVRPLRTVLANPCETGTGNRRATTPGTARAYLDWLGGFITEPTHAVPAEVLGLQGWQFDLGGDGKQTFDPQDPCAFVSLSEPSIDLPTGSAETVAFAHNEPVRVYALDVDGGVLLVMLWTTSTEGSVAAGEAFLAGIHVAP